MDRLHCCLDLLRHILHHHPITIILNHNLVHSRICPLRAALKRTVEA